MSSLSFSFKMCISCFISPHYWFLCGSSNDSFLAAGSCVAVARFFSYCWFLCGSSKTSFLTAGSCVVAAKLPIVGSCVTTIRYFFLCLVSWVGEMLGWNLKWMCMNDEVLELSGK